MSVALLLDCTRVKEGVVVEPMTDWLCVTVMTELLDMPATSSSGIMVVLASCDGECSCAVTIPPATNGSPCGESVATGRVLGAEEDASDKGIAFAVAFDLLPLFNVSA
jgi:hypothetical protein